MRFIFPFKDIKKDSKIVLYGASVEGYDFYRQIVSTGYCCIVLWVDRQYEWWRTMNLPVEPPARIKEVVFDYIVLTAEKQSVADSMRKDLVNMGIDAGKIFWKEDCIIKGNIAACYDRERILKEADDAFEDKAANYLNENNLEVVVRALYAEDIVANKDDARHKEMYHKLMKGLIDCSEPTDDMIHSYFTEYSAKKGWEEFDISFRNLTLSMAKDGFRKNDFIPIDNKGNLINGRHRLAAALATGVKVWVRKYPFDGFDFCTNQDRLKDLGFSEEEISEVVEAYHELLRG